MLVRAEGITLFHLLIDGIMHEMFLRALKLRSCAILLEHKVKAFQMKNPQAKYASFRLLAVLIVGHFI